MWRLGFPQHGGKSEDNLPVGSVYRVSSSRDSATVDGVGLSCLLLKKVHVSAGLHSSNPCRAKVSCSTTSVTSLLFIWLLWNICSKKTTLALGHFMPVFCCRACFTPVGTASLVKQYCDRLQLTLPSELLLCPSTPPGLAPLVCGPGVITSTSQRHCVTITFTWGSRKLRCQTKRANAVFSIHQLF